jgi:hypothetical protein
MFREEAGSLSARYSWGEQGLSRSSNTCSPGPLKARDRSTASMEPVKSWESCGSDGCRGRASSCGRRGEACVECGCVEFFCVEFCLLKSSALSYEGNGWSQWDPFHGFSKVGRRTISPSSFLTF